MVSDFKSMWDDDMRPFDIANSRIEFTLANAGGKCFVPYQVSTKAREPEKNKVAKNFPEKVMMPLWSILGQKRCSCRSWMAPFIFLGTKGSLTLFRSEKSPQKYSSTNVSTRSMKPQASERFMRAECTGNWTNKKDRYQTAFNCHHSIYRFSWMPFVLWNAPSTFNQAMRAALLAVQW